MKKNVFLLLGAMFALTSCNNDNASADLTKADEVNFTLGGIKTRVSGSDFENGDVIAVKAFYAADNSVVGSADYSYANGVFSSSEAISYRSDDPQSLYYYASYPAQADLASSFDFAIAADQSAEGYETSDLLVATTEATTEATPALTFYHSMSNVIVNVEITRDGESVDMVGAEVEFSAKNNATCDVAAGTYVAAGDAAAITPATTANGKGFSAIIAPQTIASGEVFATLKVASEDATFEWTKNTDMIFNSGKQYIYTWTIDLTTGTQSIDQFEGNIGDWGDGDENNEGGSTTPDPQETKTITFDSQLGFPESAGNASFEVEGASFYVRDAWYNTQYGSYTITNGDGSFGNATELVGLSKVIITEDYKYYNFTVYAGAEFDAQTNEVEYVKEGDNYIYTIPADSKFVTFVNESEHNATCDKIEFTFESLGDTVTVPEPDEPEASTGTTFDANDLGLANAADVTSFTFGDYAVAFDNTNASNPAKFYASGEGSIRFYTGGTMTISGPEFTSIIFETEDSFNVTVNVGTYDAASKSWSSETPVSEVVFTASTTNKIEKITIE